MKWGPAGSPRRASVSSSAAIVAPAAPRAGMAESPSTGWARTHGAQVSTGCDRCQNGDRWYAAAVAFQLLLSVAKRASSIRPCRVG
jgi:hypothetical protein